MSTLLANLVAAAPRLTRRVLDEMYTDPFWQERFGPRGRGHANEDGDFHVRYLVAALEGRDPGVFTKYARWLRDVLVARGMCSLHLRDNFERLARAIASEGWPDAHGALALLDAGSDALVRREGDAARVEALATSWPDVAARVAAGDDATARAAIEWEVRCLGSFLADSLADDQDRFCPHVAFLRTLHARHHVPPERLDAQLAEMLALEALPVRAYALLVRARAAGEESRS